jgi:predicted RNA binding protein YcfA (HicA-like mRNA interferase family)
MSRYEKLLQQILAGASDANIAFDDLCSLLTRLGFEVRTRGSHHLFYQPGVMERINLQRDGSKAKPYQVRQVRKVIVEHNLGGSL